MSPDNLQPILDLPDIDQIAYVVEDIERGMDRYIDLFGVEPWTVMRIEPPELTNTTHYGESTEYGFRAGTAYAGDTMIEFIEPTVGDSIYSEHLKIHGEGLHHVAYFGWDETETQAVVEKLEDAGIEVVQTGYFQGTEFWYFDTRDELYGLMFETAIRQNVGSRETERYPPAD